MQRADVKAIAKTRLEFEWERSIQSGSEFNALQIIEKLKEKIAGTGLYDESLYLPEIEEALKEFSMEHNL